MNKVFRVSIEITRRCDDLYVVGESSDEVEKAVEADDVERYNLDDDQHVFAVEVRPDRLPPLDTVKYAVLGGEVVEVKSPEWQEHLRETAEIPPPVPDTVTLPLFEEEGR